LALSKFEQKQQCWYIQDQFPDIPNIFKSITPTEPKVYHSTFKKFDSLCLFQSQNATDSSIFFDIGCSLSSVFDINDFEEPPVKGCFGQLRTINGIVPIDVAGVIKWTVIDMQGKQVIL